MSERLENETSDGEMPQIQPDVSAEQLYLSAHFPHVAAIAWNGFNNRGRGAVLLTGVIPTHANPSPDNCVLNYATQDECAALHSQGLLRAIQEYDPATQLVCVVLSDTGSGESSYQHTHWMTSPRGPVAEAATLAMKAN